MLHDSVVGLLAEAHSGVLRVLSCEHDVNCGIHGVGFRGP